MCVRGHAVRVPYCGVSLQQRRNRWSDNRLRRREWHLRGSAAGTGGGRTTKRAQMAAIPDRAGVARFLKYERRPGRRTMMMTNTTATPSTTAAKTAADITTSTATQKVVIVNGSTDMMTLLETVLDAGHYDVVFVESNEHAYSHIKRVQPQPRHPLHADRGPRRVPGAVDAEAGRRDAPDSGAHLYDRVRRSGNRGRRLPDASDLEMFAAADVGVADELDNGIVGAE